jgi:hypothetical protein
LLRTVYALILCAMKPLHLRKLKADMALKDLTLTQVAKAAGVPLSMASEILNGIRNDPLRLNRLSAEIQRAPMPSKEEVA